MWRKLCIAPTKNLGKILIIFGVGIGIFGVDQWLKYVFLQGFSFDSYVITLGGNALVYNDGVAFSMFAFLGIYLKYIQSIMLVALCGLIIYGGFIERHYVPFGLILGAGASNVLDRFIHGGVVDYVFWHYGFEFAIFNFADVMIDVGVVLLVWQAWRAPRKP